MDTKPHVLARSAFAIVFLATLLTLILLPFLALSPVRPAARVMVGGVGAVLALLLIGLCVLIYRIPPERLDAPVRRLAGALGRGWLVGLVFFVVIEINILAYLIVTGVAPSLNLVLVILGAWSAALLLALYLAVMDTARVWFAGWRHVLVGLGGVIVAVGGLALLLALNLLVADTTRFVDQLRGNLDYRVLTFYGGEVNPEVSRAYWRELGEIRAEWLPYLYWHIEGTEGEHINISSAGVRQSANFAGEEAPQVYFFGGSTMWGEGARDAYTIPSHVSRLLHEQGTDVHVTNFGQTAYVSTQDMMLFQAQLALGNVPDVAVFYQGFNDVAGAIQEGYAGLPHNEVNRLQEFTAGQLWREGNIVLGPPAISLDGLDMSLVSPGETTPERITQVFLERVRQLQALCAAYDVELVVVWQPALMFKETLTPQEQAFVEENDSQLPGFDDVYRAVDDRVREAAIENDDLLIISDLFADETGDIFFDRVHITEDANETVARAILPEIEAALAN